MRAFHIVEDTNAPCIGSSAPTTHRVMDQRHDPVELCSRRVSSLSAYYCNRKGHPLRKVSTHQPLATPVAMTVPWGQRMLQSDRARTDPYRNTHRRCHIGMTNLLQALSHATMTRRRLGVVFHRSIIGVT